MTQIADPETPRDFWAAYFSGMAWALRHGARRVRLRDAVPGEVLRGAAVPRGLATGNRGFLKKSREVWQGGVAPVPGTGAVRRRGQVRLRSGLLRGRLRRAGLRLRLRRPRLLRRRDRDVQLRNRLDGAELPRSGLQKRVQWQGGVRIRDERLAGGVPLRGRVCGRRLLGGELRNDAGDLPEQLQRERPLHGRHVLVLARLLRRGVRKRGVRRPCNDGAKLRSTKVPERLQRKGRLHERSLLVLRRIFRAGLQHSDDVLRAVQEQM
eukprot:CAMPEP_0179006076 /NCGR_PEP_ID=MMETSP0795-20121207/14330_1 /TAXON_ID=88552 /ORGANISM="Amoebophrya sp., Strain Ameob2" /LENGTH=265 /DNA_ID=CAMNT_0020700751 /DNA_START=14 /DNA_END=812 /DNA_ORIENTATION=-